MDIKGLARNLIPFGPTKARESQNARVKTDASDDREGNGQSQGQEQQRKPLTPEEVEEAIRFLEGLAGVKDNNLTVRVAQTESTLVVYVEDRDGKVVRRIPEPELRALTQNRQKKNGHLLNRAL